MWHTQFTQYTKSNSASINKAVESDLKIFDDIFYSASESKDNYTNALKRVNNIRYFMHLDMYSKNVKVMVYHSEKISDIFLGGIKLKLINNLDIIFERLKIDNDYSNTCEVSAEYYHNVVTISENVVKGGNN